MTTLPNPKLYKYASHIEGRRPALKMHGRKSDAMNAIHYVLYTTPRGGVVYEFDNNEWQIIHQCDIDFKCIVCGGVSNWLEVVDRNVQPKCDWQYIHRGCKV